MFCKIIEVNKETKMKISCEVNGHKYVTEKLYFKDFLTIGFLIEEKIGPFIDCFTACIGNNLSDSELLKALYSSCKDILNREDMSFICDLVINREHLTIDGKKLDNADWEKFWQEVGFFDYQAVSLKFLGENLGNFTQLSALLPPKAADLLAGRLENKFSILSTVLNDLLNK